MGLTASDPPLPTGTVELASSFLPLKKSYHARLRKSMTPMAQMYDDVHTSTQTQGIYLIEIGAEAAGPLLGAEREFCSQHPYSGLDIQMENA